MELAWERLDGRDGHTVGRQLLQKMVPQLPEIAVTDTGKPYFVDSNLHFSISHTKNHVFCAVSAKNIGIDAEECDRRVTPLLATKMLSAGEFRRWQAASDPDGALLRLWVLKESYAKFTGRGIGAYLKQTDFDPNDTRIQIIDGCYVAVMEEDQ